MVSTFDFSFIFIGGACPHADHSLHLYSIGRDPLLPLECVQIGIVRRQNNRCSPLCLWRECLTVTLHGPVEIIKIRILAETLGIDAGGVGIGFGTDALRLFRALGTDCQGFLRSEEHTAELPELLSI